MPLPKTNLSKKAGHKPPAPLRVTEENSGNGDFSQEKFEMELCWCIQQLQRALKSGKLSEKQGNAI